MDRVRPVTGGNASDGRVTLMPVIIRVIFKKPGFYCCTAGYKQKEVICTTPSVYFKNNDI
ncbi:hypothetical protein A8C56_05700 [Niabella ginsenosidivorans]|uniref:Uncharacterized protein n=1 Tax=Niabella ginsenosidivorans TaxID=1176587 RepID=A0A1A9I1H4_9BACT|nr:hypothetical protein A8C56_05700 [Niabella ginsenosidivorans]